MTPNPETITPASTSKTYSSFGADINLVVDKGAPCRLVRINDITAGTSLAVTFADGSTDTWVNLAAGDQITANLKLIRSSGTTLSGITVFW